MSLEYKKYLEEVVQLLESDDAFKAELEKMDAGGDNVRSLVILEPYLFHACSQTPIF